MIGLIYPNKTRNSLTYIQRARIKVATKDGDSVNKIILKEHLHCSKDVLHIARRSILKDLRDEEMSLFVKTLCDFQNWTNIVIIDETNKFRCSYSFNIAVMDTNYSTDVCILDDTMCTNFYGLPLEVIIVEDENGKNQLLTFALMENKCKPSFIQYFKNLRSLIGPIRVFVTDHNQTQISALEEVFPESNNNLLH